MISNMKCTIVQLCCVLTINKPCVLFEEHRKKTNNHIVLLIFSIMHSLLLDIRLVCIFRTLNANFKIYASCSNVEKNILTFLSEEIAGHVVLKMLILPEEMGFYKTNAMK